MGVVYRYRTDREITFAAQMERWPNTRLTEHKNVTERTRLASAFSMYTFDIVGTGICLKKLKFSTAVSVGIQGLSHST